MNAERIASFVDPVIDGAIADRRLVGAVVLIDLEGRPLYRRAAGMADREAGAPMRVDTIFRLASLTKPIVTAAAMAMIERGRLSIDDPVARWLPAFTPKLKDGSTPLLTVRHLLTHTGGLGYGFIEPLDGAYHRAGVSDGLDMPGRSMEENLRRLAGVPLLDPPGARWRYSVGLDVLGAVLAGAAGKSLGEVVQQYVTDPLGMPDTAFAVRDRDRLAAAYADGPQGAVRMGARHVVPFAGLAGIAFAPDRIFDEGSFPSAGAGMAGTGPDMMRVLEAIRQGGGAVVSPSMAEQMMRNQTGDLPLDLAGPGWGFGFGGAVLVDPAAAGTPQSPGTWRWGGVYGHTWFVDPVRELTVVGMTNTAIEGMAGQYTIDLRDAVYRALG
ncbi:MAG: serine hydrolase domain-containing protein [Burkholderiaceae bacterium]